MPLPTTINLGFVTAIFRLLHAMDVKNKKAPTPLKELAPLPNTNQILIYTFNTNDVIADNMPQKPSNTKNN